MRQQREIISAISRLEDKFDMINFKTERQYDEINSRLEINERSTRQIDEQLALANALRHDELKDLRPTLKRLQELEEFLRLDVATRLLDSLEEFLFKLGLMTQKNHTELLQSVDGLRMSIESLTTEITKLNLKVAESHTDLSNKISSLVDATKKLSTHVTENFSKIEIAQNNLDKKLLTLTTATSDNQSVLEEKFSAFSDSSIANDAEIKNSLITITEKLYIFADAEASIHTAFDKKLKRTITNHNALDKKISDLAEATTDNRNALAKGIFSLATQMTTDSRAVKESLENVEDLLRLTAANQIMNLIDK